MKTVIRALVALLLVVLVGSALAAPVEANTKSGRDPRGDAPRRYDMTYFAATFNDDVLRLKFRVPDIGAVGGIRTELLPATGGYFSYLQVQRNRRYGARAGYNEDRGDGEDFTCPAKTNWNVRKGIVVTSVDASCVHLDRFDLRAEVQGGGEDSDFHRLGGMRRG